MVQLLAYGVQHVRMAVAEDHRTPGAHVVHVALVVLVRHIGAFRVFEEQRGAADALEGADRRVDAPGDVFLGVGEQGFGTGHGRSLFQAKSGSDGVEQGAEGTGAAFHLGSRVGAEQGVDHRHHAGATGDQLRGVFQGHAADGDDRRMEALAGLL
ncbi:hypothetical protein D9M68_406280 [compost metagenome]